MTTRNPEKSLLHSFFASNATVQQPPLSDATPCATTAQQAPAKPLSLLDVARNKLRNNHATSSENGTQQAQFFGGKNRELVARSSCCNSGMQQAPAVSSWGWRVTYPDGRVFESYIVPVQTLDGVQEMYPGARVEPIAEVEV